LVLALDAWIAGPVKNAKMLNLTHIDWEGVYMELEQIRHNIDRLDSTILKLLNERLEMGLLTKRFKQGIEDKKREEEVVARTEAFPTGVASPDFTKRLYLDIIKESKRLQRMDAELIAFQGEHGAYGEVASKAWKQEMIPIPCKRFDEVFYGVQSGTYDYGIVPVENSLGGPVEQVNRLLIDTPLRVVGAVKIPVHLCLLALPETDHRELRSAYSHPQALLQCRRFLARNRLEPIQFGDTAGAARMVSEKGLTHSAAIASRLSAGLYQLEIVKENIEDLKSNMTRFLVLARNENNEQADKCSIVFSTEHKAGTLFSVLELFAVRNINLTRIESIPHEPGAYAFFLDFEGSSEREEIMAALEETRKITTHFKNLGFYKEESVS